MTLTVRLAATLAIASLAAGCAGSNKSPSSCPSVQVLADAADLTIFREGQQDITDMIIDARISGVPARCSAGDSGHVITTMSVALSVSRGPAAPSRDVQLQYFVAVANPDRIIEQQDYIVPISFPPNVDKMSYPGDEIVLDIPVVAGKPASSYSIYVAFRLTPEQLAFNRKRGPR